MRNFAQRLLPYFPWLRFWLAKRKFLQMRGNTLRLLGPFESAKEAKKHIPAQVLNATQESRPFLDFGPEIREDDIHVVRILDRLISQTHMLFDFGGNVGACFYQYRSAMVYPPTLRWIVHDFPNVASAGRQLAKDRGETQLTFTNDPNDASGADVYLTAGTLQYLENPFADTLGQLTEKPRHLLINRVPMTDAAPFYALQYALTTIHVYYIPNRCDFIASLELLGYRLVKEWKCNRSSDVILRPDLFIRNYCGFYFERV